MRRKIQTIGQLKLEKPIEVVFEGSDTDIYKSLKENEIPSDFLNFIDKEVPEDFVLLRIYDEVSPENLEIVFQGWMISSSPTVAPFEHPIYDVWVKVGHQKVTVSTPKHHDSCVTVPQNGHFGHPGAHGTTKHDSMTHAS